MNGKSTFCFQFQFWLGFSEQEFQFSIFDSILTPMSIRFRFSFSQWEFQILNGWWIFFQFNSVFRTWKTNLSTFNLFLGFLLFFYVLYILMELQISIQNVDSQHSVLSLTLAANVEYMKSCRFRSIYFPIFYNLQSGYNA